MRLGGILIATTALFLWAAPAPAQNLGTGLSALQIGVACAPPPALVMEPHDAIHVLGGQDSEGRQALGDQDRVILSAGVARGLAVGQEYFLRRVNIDPSVPGMRYGPTTTSGWVTIAAVNDNNAIATVERPCGPILSGDFIEPFVRPNPPADIDRAQPGGQLDFGTLGRVMFGNEQHHNSAAGDYVLIDQGTDHGLTPGMHIALYRDPDVAGMPLVEIGEAGVVSVAATISLVRVNVSKAEIKTGDYVVPKR